jgi:hypothetical protein
MCSYEYSNLSEISSRSQIGEFDDEESLRRLGQGLGEEFVLLEGMLNEDTAEYGDKGESQVKGSQGWGGEGQNPDRKSKRKKLGGIAAEKLGLNSLSEALRGSKFWEDFLLLLAKRKVQQRLYVHYGRHLERWADFYRNEVKYDKDLLRSDEKNQVGDGRQKMGGGAARLSAGGGGRDIGEGKGQVSGGAAKVGHGSGRSYQAMRG